MHASTSGLFGYRATPGALPNKGVASVAGSLDSLGLVARDPDLLLRLGHILQLPGGGCKVEVKGVGNRCWVEGCPPTLTRFIFLCEKRYAHADMVTACRTGQHHASIIMRMAVPICTTSSNVR